LPQQVSTCAAHLLSKHAWQASVDVAPTAHADNGELPPGLPLTLSSPQPATSAATKRPPKKTLAIFICVSSRRAGSPPIDHLAARFVLIFRSECERNPPCLGSHAFRKKSPTEIRRGAHGSRGGALGSFEAGKCNSCAQACCSVETTTGNPCRTEVLRAGGRVRRSSSLVHVPLAPSDCELAPSDSEAIRTTAMEPARRSTWSLRS
jgi:hypothetical protein